MTTTHTNLALVEGEVYLLLNDEIKVKDSFYDSLFKTIHYCNKIGVMGIIYDDKASVCFGGESELSRIKKAIKLDRKHFVKPKVDVGDIANKFARRQEFFPYSSDAYTGFLAGHNAKEAEFTREEMYECALKFFYHWYNAKGTNTAQGLQEWLPTYIDSLSPIRLPKSIALNDNNEVIDVQWD